MKYKFLCESNKNLLLALAEGLMEIPPVSKVTPFPTKITGSLSPPLAYFISRNLGGSALPLATLRNDPSFVCSAHAWSLTVELVSENYLGLPSMFLLNSD